MKDIAGINARSAAEILDLDTSYFLPWRLEMLYEIEPELQRIAERTVLQKRRRFQAKHDAYVKAMDNARDLLGWGARDPRLRSSEAWEYFFRYILDELNI